MVLRMRPKKPRSRHNEELSLLNGHRRRVYTSNSHIYINQRNILQWDVKTNKQTNKKLLCETETTPLKKEIQSEISHLTSVCINKFFLKCFPKMLIDFIFHTSSVWISFLNNMLLQIVWVFSSHSRIFHSFGDITIAGENFDIYIYFIHQSWALVGHLQL